MPKPAISSCSFLSGTFGVGGGDFSGWQGLYWQSFRWVLPPSLSMGNIYPQVRQLPSHPAVFTCDEVLDALFGNAGQHLWARLLSLFPAPHPTPVIAISFHPSLSSSLSHSFPPLLPPVPIPLPRSLLPVPLPRPELPAQPGTRLPSAFSQQNLHPHHHPN